MSPDVFALVLGKLDEESRVRFRDQGSAIRIMSQVGNLVSLSLSPGATQVITLLLLSRGNETLRKMSKRPPEWLWSTHSTTLPQPPVTQSEQNSRHASVNAKWISTGRPCSFPRLVRVRATQGLDRVLGDLS